MIIFSFILLFAALQKYRLGKQSGKDSDEGCKDGMFVPLYFLIICH